MTGQSSIRAQLFIAAKGSAIVRVAALALTVGTSVILARVLGPAAYGTYAYVIAIVSLLALPAQVGIPTLLVRETAKAEARKNWAELNGLWSWASQTIVGTSFVIAAVAATVIHLQGNLSPDLRLALLLGLLLVPLMALGNARGAALRGLHKVVLGQLPETVLSPGMLIAFIALAWYAGWPLNAALAIAWQALAAGLAFLIGALLLIKARPAELHGTGRDKRNARYWWGAALPLAIMGGLQTVGNQSGIVFLGWYRPETDVALYKIASAAASLISFGLQTANLILGPHFARQHALNDTRRLQRLAAVGALASAALTLPAIAFFAIGGEWILKLLYGKVYAGAYGPLIILCVGQLVNALFGSVGLLLNMTGLERSAARWLAIAAASNVGLGLVLIPFWGIYGAAIAASASLIIWNVAYWRIAFTKLDVDGSVWSIVKLVKHAI